MSRLPDLELTANFRLMSGRSSLFSGYDLCPARVGPGVQGEAAYYNATGLVVLVIIDFSIVLANLFPNASRK